MTRKLYFKMALMCCLICMTGCKEAPKQQHNAQRSIINLQPKDIEIDSRYSASIRGKQDIKIMPRVSGYITEIHTLEGSKVKKGDKLFVIDQVEFIAALENAKANVELSKANVATAQLTYDSRKNLHQKNIVSDFDLATAQNNLLTAQAQLKMAEAQQEIATNNLSYTIIKSPSDGIVGKIQYRIGDYVTPQLANGLTVIADNSNMYIYFSMNERQMLDLLSQYHTIEKAIEQMPEVKLQLSNGKIYKHVGKIESISGIIENTTGAVSVRALFPNPDGFLLSGGAGNIIIPSKHKDVFIIPQQATFEAQDKIFVYRIIDGVTKSTIIEVDKINNGLEYIVVNGLNKDDIIVAEGAGLLSENTPITILSKD